MIKLFVLWCISTVLVGPLIGRFIKGRTDPNLNAAEVETVTPIDRIVEEAQASPHVARPSISSTSILTSRDVKNVAH